MMVHRKRFNIYLLAALAAVLAFGCESPETKKQKQVASLQLHLETNAGGMNHTEVAQIFRQSPIDVTVEKTAFLTEGSISEAKLINAMGGFEISLQFNREGTWLLEQYTTANRGRKIAVLCQFGKDLKERRWLAAPVITKHISDGLFVFTPDASHEEAEEIVHGLNNVAKQMHGWMHDQ